MLINIEYIIVQFTNPVFNCIATKVLQHAFDKAPEQISEQAAQQAAN